jgi:hypothetical protein
MKIIYFIINNLASLHRDTRKQIKYVPGLQIPRHASLNTAVYQDSAKIMLLLFTASMRSATLTAHTSGPLALMFKPRVKGKTSLDEPQFFCIFEE